MKRMLTIMLAAGLWASAAGAVGSYSDALKSSGIVVWSDDTLDQWLTDPQHLVPGNAMPFRERWTAHERLLGAQSALHDRYEGRRTGAGRAGHRARRNDG